MSDPKIGDPFNYLSSIPEGEGAYFGVDFKNMIFKGGLLNENKKGAETVMNICGDINPKIWSQFDIIKFIKESDDKDEDENKNDFPCPPCVCPPGVEQAE